MPDKFSNLNTTKHLGTGQGSTVDLLTIIFFVIDAGMVLHRTPHLLLPRLFQQKTYMMKKRPFTKRL